ncbi:MAG: Asp-tRNA(Asn)/Glu-tRNA(Gln) amidotransferase GatCAB subunit C [Dehalococcoidia bacterium]|nr:Asp-tRNA(Asn)/Glu-tRNA(Gln) amidotransferase GatCAB subunit C [Dehalococcoidia bacterium]MEC7921185.1 Asp-tRNA(Asn)/Glu-tRNA(Gln) amidotransferase subunit GatC [Chloroflexota bacterium]MEC9450802.1 Asp-tRNA(Asn)/Glu-tRNA(Gln) amidotransferase subunit GatC [Chloroflexota bacterium]|tara:strand:+ start:2786 stop:3097 length:312 start_codon:yes stop_codon:yes gene_type:complete
MNSENKHFDINKIAELAKLNLDPKEVDKFESQMVDIISYFSSLQKIDTSNFNLKYWEIDENKITDASDLRSDDESSGFSEEEIFSNAPAKESKFIKIKKILDR